MKVVEAPRYGGVDVLQVVDRPAPDSASAAARGRVRVRVRAASVNPADGAILGGVMAERTPQLPFPFVLGWEFCGELLDATDVIPAGTRVAGFVPWLPLGDGTGAWSEVLAAEPTWLAPVPDSVDDAHAGVLPMIACTADQALRMLGLDAGQTLLVTGASGAVGSIAVQLAAQAGVEVIALASDGDVDYVSSLGAKHVLARSDDALGSRVAEITPGGVDGVLDAAALVGPAMASVGDGGRFVAVMDHVQPQAERGVAVSVVHCTPVASRIEQMLAQVGAGSLSVRLGATYPVGDVAAAITAAGRPGGRGKLVLTF